MKFMLVTIVLYLLCSFSNARPSMKPKAGCGYDSCHPTSKDVLNVHLVPHSHDDVGWLKTVDQYYYGSRTNIQRAGVQYILDSTIDELLKNPDRRFIYVESAFLEKWWLEQTKEKQEQVKQLINEGRLEIAGGAWSMNDEANVHYHSIIDQLTWGFRFLNDTFGECGRPRAGWQIDPFGHARELASIWALAGFDGLILGRIDYQDRQTRKLDKEMEMIWRGSDDLGSPSDILTGILFTHYSPPPGFCFDLLCSDEPVIDDVNSSDYNVDQMVDRFLAYVENQAKAYKTNNIILTMGDDFFYQDANMWYKNLDKLIKYVNERQNDVKLIYSTPSCYIKALYDTESTWSVKQDDFFPYGSDGHAYWTGYFTSRPTIKYYERKGNNILQVCKQLQSMTDPSDETGLRSLRGAMGVMQHHDAITGTEKQHVAEDYAKILEFAIQQCTKVSEKALNTLMNTASYLDMKICTFNNTECDITEQSDKFILTVYNPLSQSVDEIVRIPVSGNKYDIRDNSGASIEYYVTPISENLIDQLVTRKSNVTNEVLFKDSIPALGYKSYYVEKNNAKKLEKLPVKNNLRSIENEYVQVTLDENTNLINKIVLKENGETVEIPLTQEILYYEGRSGTNSAATERASGAYVFRPTTETPISFGTPSISTYENDLVSEIHQKFSDWTSQTIRLYRGQKHVEFDWLIGPIPINDNNGKEVITRLSTDFVTDSTFYTDSNGRQLLKRITNHRPTWNLTLEEPVSGNYYPITSMIGIKDTASKRELYLLNDRAQGGSSLKDGQIELMMHRRLLHDDSFGVGEALNETAFGIGLIARGKHYLVFGNSDDSESPIVHSRQLALKKLLEPIVFVSKADIAYKQWMNQINTRKGIEKALPQNIHLLTLEPWNDGTVLLRLEHFFQKTDDPDNLSKPQTVDLDDLLNGIEIQSVKEVTIGANQWVDQADRLKWKSSNEILDDFNERYHKNCTFSTNDIENSCVVNKNLLYTHKIPDQELGEDIGKATLVTLNPMEIKTFIITVASKM